MASRIQNTFLASLGIVQITYEKAERLGKDLVSRGLLARDNKDIFIDNLIEKAQKNTAELDKKTNSTIKELASRGTFLVDVAKVKGVDSKIEIRDRVKRTIQSVLNKGKSIKEGVKRDKKSFNKVLDLRVEETLNKLNIPTKEDLEKINNKLDILIEEMKKKGE